MKLWRRASDLWAEATGSPVLPTAFAAGVSLALAHLAISLEIGVSLTYHRSFTRTLFLALYPLGVSFMGLGAVLERRLSARVPTATLTDAALRAAGVSLLLFLVLALRVNFFVASLAGLVVTGMLHLVVLSAWFLALGAAVSSLLRAARRSEAPRRVAGAWTMHLFGLLLGYAATDFLVHSVGANAILFSIGIALLTASRRAPFVLAALLAASAAVSLDARIEDLRDLTALRTGRIWSIPDRAGQSDERYMISQHQETREILFRGWSRFGHVQITRTKDGDFRGYYNLRPQWSIPTPATRGTYDDLKWRTALYGAVGPASRILLLAVGGGRGVSCLPLPPHKGVTTVELNETVVRFLRDVRPDLNDGGFSRTTALAADARFAVDTTTETFDAVLVETGRFHTAHLLEPAGSPQSLYTRESVDLYLSRLKSGGLLLMVFDGIYPNPVSEYLPLQVVRSLTESRVPFRVVSASDKGSTYVAIGASRDPTVLDRLVRRASDISMPGIHPEAWVPQSEAAAFHYVRLTDDRPFDQWLNMSGPRRRRILAAAALLVVIPALLAAAFCRVRARPRPERGGPPVLFFFLIGSAQVMMSIGVAYAFRSFFGDGVTTTIRLTLYALAYGAMGSLLSHRLVGTGRGRIFASAATLMGLYAAGLAFIPFEAGSAWTRELSAAVILLPGGLFMGALFPAGILSASGEDVDRCLLADSLGAVAGYGSFYLILLPWGIHAFLAASFAAYAAAMMAFPARAGDTS